MTSPHPASTAAADRATGVESIKASCEREAEELVAEHTRASGALRRAHSARVEEAERAAAARRADLAAALAADLKAQLYPAIARFGGGGRGDVEEIARVWRTLTARCRLELGDDLVAYHLGLAFAGDDPRAGDGHAFWRMDQGPAQRAADLARDITSGAGLALIEEALCALEVAVERARARARPFPAGLELRQSSMTARDFHHGSAALGGSAQGL